MSIRTEYIFKIDTAYVLTNADNQEIANDKAKFKKWKDGYKIVKSKIRKHLKNKQNGRCAFCRGHMNSGQGYPNIEHILSKKDYPQFTFLPENLVFCCWKCNKSKGKKNTISFPIPDKSHQIFPFTSKGFVIVNPYHDNYEDHIDFIDNVVIIKREGSIKGENTIEYYNLARPELAEDRAFEFKLDEKSINQQLLARLTNINNNDQITITQINSIINQLPEWKL